MLTSYSVNGSRSLAIKLVAVLSAVLFIESPLAVGLNWILKFAIVSYSCASTCQETVMLLVPVASAAWFVGVGPAYGVKES